MSRSELHNWECAIEKLSGDNADKMLAIAQDIYNTAFVRGKNHMTLVEMPEARNDVLDKIKTEIKQLRIHKAQFITDDNKVCIDSQEVLNVIDKYIEGSESE